MCVLNYLKYKCFEGIRFKFYLIFYLFFRLILIFENFEKRSFTLKNPAIAIYDEIYR